MPRKRTDPKTKWMPPRVYRGKSAYEFHPKGGGAIRLCPLDSAQSVVWKEYEKHNTRDNDANVSAIIQSYFESAHYTGLSKNTQADYVKASRNIIKVFGRMRPNDVQPHHVRQYMDKRGTTSKVQANREKSFMSAVYSWCYERGKVKTNPCKGVRKFPETARTRYITNREYELVYKHAKPHVQIAMEISYLCAARKTDVLTLKWSQIDEDGIYIKQGKTGKAQIKSWTPRLRLAIEQAKKLREQSSVISAAVIRQKNGKFYSGRGFDEGWRVARQAARDETGEPLDFTFHDIKAKSISDFEGTTQEKQNFSGHKTERQVASYDRKVPIVPSLGTEKP